MNIYCPECSSSIVDIDMHSDGWCREWYECSKCGHTWHDHDEYDFGVVDEGK